MASLKAKFYSYARKFHPDHNSGNNAEMMAAMNNEAYRCLIHPLSRIEHVLKIAGVRIEDNPSVSGEFLMEVMELQESIFDLKLNDDIAKKDKMSVQLNGFLEGLDQDLGALEESLDLSSDIWNLRLLENWKRRKYLQRMMDHLD